MRTPTPPPGLIDQLVIGALLLALEPAWTPVTGAATLIWLAAGDHFALRRALARIQARYLQRSTSVVDRAATALRLALGSLPCPAVA